MIVYKLTDAEGKTHDGMCWAVGVRQVVPTERRGVTLCTHGVIHAYRSPEQALLLNPVHANIDEPLLWRAETPAIAADDGCKVGVHDLTTVACLPLPAWWLDEAVRWRVQVTFALLCAEAVLPLYVCAYPRDARPARALAAARAYFASLTRGGPGELGAVESVARRAVSAAVAAWEAASRKAVSRPAVDAAWAVWAAADVVRTAAVSTAWAAAAVAAQVAVVSTARASAADVAQMTVGDIARVAAAVAGASADAARAAGVAPVDTNGLACQAVAQTVGGPA